VSDESETRQQVLKDHVRKGKRLIPPFRHSLGKRYQPYSWARQLVPEVFWIGLLIDTSGLASAVKIATALMAATKQSFADRDNAPLLSMFSAYANLTTEQHNAILNNIDEDVLISLRPLVSLIDHLLGQNSFSFLRAGLTDEAVDNSPNVDNVSRVLMELNDRSSRLSVLSIATSVYIGMRQGKIVHVRELFEKRMRDFDAVVSYPKTEASKVAASAFRASAPMLLMQHTAQGELGESPWVEVFWSRIVAFGDCDPV
jgi:hypothetical protein